MGNRIGKPHFAPLNETIELKQCQWMALKYLLESLARNLMIENYVWDQLHSIINFVLTVSDRIRGSWTSYCDSEKGTPPPKKYSGQKHVHWKKMHNLQVESYVYSAGSFRERASQIKLFGCFSRGRSGGLVFPSLSDFSTVYCDPHSQRLWHSQ